MSDEVFIPYEWAKTLRDKNLELDETPLFGYAPPFPLGEFFSALAAGFELEPFPFEVQTVGWQEGNELKDGYNGDLFLQNFSISGIEGTLSLLLDREDLRYLMHYFLTKDPPSEVPTFEEELEQGMYRYFALESVRACNATGLGKSLSLHLLSDKSLPEGPCYAFDTTLTLPGKTISFRLLITKAFQHAYKEKNSAPSMRVKVSRELFESTSVPFSIEIGGSTLTKEGLAGLKEGDLLLLDRCYVDPNTQEGKAILSYNDQPRLSGTIKGKSLMIEANSVRNEPIRSLMARKTI